MRRKERGREIRSARVEMRKGECMEIKNIMFAGHLGMQETSRYKCLRKGLRKLERERKKRRDNKGGNVMIEKKDRKCVRDRMRTKE